VSTSGRTRTKNDFLSHFQRILGTKEPRGCGLNWSELNLTQLPEYHGIDEVFTEYEIKRDIDLLPLPSEKAPGPDGFTGAFF
jgi:hypothetical protein